MPTPMTTNTAMRTNSRFPIDLASVSVVKSETGRSRPPESYPDCSADMRSHLRAALVLLLTVGLVAYFLRGVNLGEVWAQTRHADGRLLAAGVLVTLMTYSLRAFRWQYLLAPIGPTRFSTAFQTTVIGFAASFLLPARAGEVLRPYLLARREKLPPTACFATIILERLLDLVTVLLLFGVFVLLVDPRSLSGDPALYVRVKTGGLLAAGASVVGCIVFYFLAGHPET